jgi:hypothetical protein
VFEILELGDEQYVDAGTKKCTIIIYCTVLYFNVLLDQISFEKQFPAKDFSSDSQFKKEAG